MLVEKKREYKKKLNHEVYVTFRVSGVAFCRQEEHVFSEEDSTWRLTHFSDLSCM